MIQDVLFHISLYSEVATIKNISILNKKLSKLHDYYFWYLKFQLHDLYIIEELNIKTFDKACKTLKLCKEVIALALLEGIGDPSLTGKSSIKISPYKKHHDLLIQLLPEILKNNIPKNGYITLTNIFIYLYKGAFNHKEYTIEYINWVDKKVERCNVSLEDINKCLYSILYQFPKIYLMDEWGDPYLKSDCIIKMNYKTVKRLDYWTNLGY